MSNEPTMLLRVTAAQIALDLQKQNSKAEGHKALTAEQFVHNTSIIHDYLMQDIEKEKGAEVTPLRPIQ